MGKVTCKMDARLSVTLQNPHRILSHRVRQGACTPPWLKATRLKVNYICLSFMHDCVLFQWPGFWFLESTFDFQWSARNCSFPRQCWHHTTPPSNCSGHGSVCFFQVHHKGPALYSQTPKLQLTHWCSRYSEYARGDRNQEVSLYWTFSHIIRILVQSKTILKIFLALHFCIPSFFWSLILRSSVLLCLLLPPHSVFLILGVCTVDLSIFVCFLSFVSSICQTRGSLLLPSLSLFFFSF